MIIVFGITPFFNLCTFYLDFYVLYKAVHTLRAGLVKPYFSLYSFILYIMYVPLYFMSLDNVHTVEPVSVYFYMV